MPSATQPAQPAAPSPQRTAAALAALSATVAAAAPAAHAFKGLRDPIEVFRAGTHTDSKGRTATFTQADLDQMVANVSGAGVPAVLGHPQETDRAWAWGKLRRDGDALLAEFSHIDPAFEAYVDAGAYRERSVAVYRDAAAGWKVAHIGWLGAVPPALALRPLDYSDDSTRTHSAAAGAAGRELLSFSSSAATGWALGDVARLLRGLRDWLISDKGLDLADKVLPDWTITALADTGRRVAEEAHDDGAAAPMPLYHHGAPMPQTINTAAPAAPAASGTTAAAALPEAELQRIREEATAALQAQFAAQGQELAELRAQRQAERIGVQINTWKASGLVPPADEPGMAEFMAALEGGQAGEFTFSRPAQPAPEKQTPAQWFAAYVARRQAVRLAGAGGAAAAAGAMGADPGPALDTQDYRAIARAAEEYVHTEAQAGRTVSVAQAVAHVTSPSRA